jgi:hypothetical protein
MRAVLKAHVMNLLWDGLETLLVVAELEWEMVWYLSSGVGNDHGTLVGNERVSRL